jgi:hypothetical protein
VELNSEEVLNLARVEALEASHMVWRQLEVINSVLLANLEQNLSLEAFKKLHLPVVLHLDQPVNLVEWDPEQGNLVPTQQVHSDLVLVDLPQDQVDLTLLVWVVLLMTLMQTST